MKRSKTSGTIVGVALVLVLCATCVCGGGLAFWIAQREPDLAIFSRTPAATSGGTLRFFQDAPATLDPALVQDVTSASYVVEIFSGLVTLDQELDVTPDLASRWEVSADGTRYTFYLRESVQFHNGKPVTAADVKFSLERACSPALGSPVALTYLGDIVGAYEYALGQATEISGIRVLDDRTVAITIGSAKSYFLAKLTYSTAFVVDQENVRQANWTDRPNGTGPFKLAQRSADRIELVRNERYYRGVAKLARVQILHSGGDPMTMYEGDEIDLVQVGVSDIERVQDPSNPLYSALQIAPNLNVQYVAFNVEQPPFDDVRVRQAFNHATDRDKLANVVLKGMASPARGILPPDLPGYNERLTGLAYDPALARQLLAQSRYGGELPPIVLHISGDLAALPRTIEALLAMWEENLGVAVTVEATPWVQFLDDINERRYQMFSLGWMADYPDPHNFLDVLFHSESDENHTNYANPQVDRLLEQARVEQDEERRLEIYQQAEQIIVNDAVWIPLWHDREYWLIKPYVVGVYRAPTVIPWLKDVSISGS